MARLQRGEGGAHHPTTRLIQFAARRVEVTAGRLHQTEQTRFDMATKRKSTRTRKAQPAPPPAAAFPGTVAEKITVAKHVVLSTVAAHDAETLEDANYDLHWPLSLVAELLEQASLQLDAEETIHAIAQAQPGKVGVFTDDSVERVPCKDFPPALACGFCGSTSDIYVVANPGFADGETWFRVACGQCGVDAGGGDTAKAAAESWNERGQFTEVDD
jgi:hypothetical protein